MRESFRNQDMRAEQQLGEFMDAYFYSRLKANDGSPLTYTRMRDKNSQLKGIDVCIEAEERKIYIDEKASIYYSNAMLPTFAFELDSIQKGHMDPVEGWFINDDLKTGYYMLIWPNVKCYKPEKQGTQWVRKDLKKIVKEDFTIVEAMLIEKKELRIFLERKGYDRDYLSKYAKYIRDLYSKESDKQDQEITENVKISYSGQLAEKPINLVIRKEVLRDLAKAVYLISADGYASIKG